MLKGRPQAQFQVALLLLSQGLLEFSEELLRSVTEQLPASYPAHLNLALSQKRLAKLPEAARTARIALALDETAEIHALLGDLLEGAGKSHLRRWSIFRRRCPSTLLRPTISL